MAKERVVGNPLDKSTTQGTQIDKGTKQWLSYFIVNGFFAEQFDRVMSYIQSGKSSGARLTTGGERVGNKGTEHASHHLPPTQLNPLRALRCETKCC